MANEIGQILGEGQSVPNSPLGATIIQQEPQQSALQPTPEMLKDPKYHAIGEWIRKPENMLTALVLAGSLMQDRRPGQSKLDAIAERGLGTLGFRGEMRRLNQKDADEAAKRQSEIDWRTGQTKVAQERNAIDREGVGVQREQVEATKENTRAQISGQERMNTQDNATQLMIAQMEDSWRRYTAGLELELGKLKETGSFGLDDKTIVDIFKNYGDAKANGVDLPPPGETVQFILRNKIGSSPEWQKQVGFKMFKGPDGRNYVDVDPYYRGLLGIPDPAAQVAPSVPTTKPPTAKPKPTPKPQKSAAEMRKERTEKEVEAVRGVGRAIGNAAQWYGETQNKPKEKF